ncbi:MAG: hypothetical protein ABR875_03085 [Minisyncoccia bacterium]|jgi:hypothetical protein
MKRHVLLFVFTVLVLALAPVSSFSRQSSTNKDDFKRQIMARYDGKLVAPVVDGLIAGEFKKAGFSLGQGSAGLVWYHYDPSTTIPDRKSSLPLQLLGKKISDMDQFDARTFADRVAGLNISRLAKGELLKVSKIYILPDNVQLDLVVTDIGHTSDTRVITSGEFGMRFSFFFDKEKVMKVADYQTVVSEINKYFLPENEAKALIEAANNIVIEPGMSEEAVIQMLGKPMKTQTFGNKKTLFFKDTTVILVDGKVTDVKVP